ncbi:hypothetical protein Golax_001125, partial [Gossypium laxum]|nr:hypothetical protein [Gossypium laxum]
MEGRTWLFRKSLILFDKLTQSLEISQIRLHLSPFWLKISPCLPEFDKKDLLHAIGVTFGGVLRSEICREWCRLKINLNVQKPLRRVGHGLSDCSEWNPAEKIKIKEDPPYTLALKAESNVIGKERGLQSSGEEKLMEEQKEVSTDMKDEQMNEIKNMQVINLNLAKKTSWRRDISNQSRAQRKDESSIRKRKANKDEVEIGGIEEVYEDRIKRLKKDGGKICGKMLTEVMINEMEQSDVCLLMGSAAANRQVRRSCGFQNGIDVEAEGSRGGLYLAWKEEINVTLRSFSMNHIDDMKLGQDQSHPWLVSRDFNEIMYSFEKSGGLPRDERRMEAFRETLEECHLVDLGYTGVWFTWERGNLPETNIRERLDRGVANDKWRNLFPTSNIHYLTHS